jgi:signal transduction histidine kinase
LSALTAAEFGKVLFFILAFGVMGLRIPDGSEKVKSFYTVFELVLIGGVISSADTLYLSCLTPLLLIVLLRSCLRFKLTGRLILTGLMLLAYTLTAVPLKLIVWYLLDLKSGAPLNPSHSAITITPEGGLQINLSPQQFQDLLSWLQKSVLHSLLHDTLLFCLILAFVLLLTNAVISERQGRRKLALAHEQLYQYSLQIEDQATLQERARIAREIHDSLGHLLTAQSIQLESALLFLRSNLDEVETFLLDSQRLGKNAMLEVRQALEMLQSDALQGRTLSEAISDLITDFSRMNGFYPDCTIDTPSTIPKRIQVAVYRISEEALTNIYKYSNATQVKIELTTKPLESRLDALGVFLQIEDNGKGFNIGQNATGYGLRGMRERAESLGGELKLISQLNEGCQVSVYFPLPNVFT